MVRRRAGVRKLSPQDVPEIVRLRVRALGTDPGAFGASPDSDSASDPRWLRDLIEDPRQALFGAFDDRERLVGMVGIRCREGKALHRAQIWGMYVASSGRGHGTGRALLDAAVRFARETDGVLQVHLEVSEGADAAAALYESAGFETWGEETRSMQVNGRFIAQRHMLLKLDGEGGP